MKLECVKVEFKENFIMCELDGFEAILIDTFLESYNIDIFLNDFK